MLKDFKKIYVLVSGGMDSTLLAEYVSSHYPEKTYYVNCYNPYETSVTLSDFQTKGLLIIKPDSQYNYAEILKNAFLKLNDAALARENGKYGKHIFQCCAYIKHKAFMNDPLFKEPDCVVMDGIKAGDGRLRALWLTGLRTGEVHTQNVNVTKGFFHRHKGGQLYCYPYRDYFKRELPNRVINELRKKYTSLTHSGCAICPVVVLFFHEMIRPDPNTVTRFHRGVTYFNQLGIKPSPILIKYCPELGNQKLI